MDAQVDSERLTQDDILGFFQMLIVGGQETTTNLINNAVLCFIEHPDQLARLRAGMRLLTTAIEEVLRLPFAGSTDDAHAHARYRCTAKPFPAARLCCP